MEKVILSDANGSPKSRNIADLEERTQRLDKYEYSQRVYQLDFADIVGTELWREYWEDHDKLHDLMKKAQQSQMK